MRRPSTLASAAIVLMLTLAITLAGCVPLVTNTRPSRMNAPNLRYLSALSDNLATSGYFRIAAVFEQRGAAKPQALTFYQNNLEVIGLDGQGARLIPTDGACMGDAAVSPDGLWAACVFLGASVASATVATYKLAITSLSPHGGPAHHDFELGDEQPRVGPVWSPVGHYLAVGVDCAVEIFAVSPDRSQLSLVGRAGGRTITRRR